MVPGFVDGHLRLPELAGDSAESPLEEHIRQSVRLALSYGSRVRTTWDEPRSHRRLQDADCVRRAPVSHQRLPAHGRCGSNVGPHPRCGTVRG